MKKIFVILFIVSYVVLITACSNSKHGDTVTTNKTDTLDNSVDSSSTAQLIDDACPQFIINGIVHNGAITTTLYDGALRLFDYSLIDGYTFKGLIFNDDNTVYNPSLEFQSNFSNGASVLYNAQKNSYILWIQNDRAWLEIYEHTCNEDCIKTDD